MQVCCQTLSHPSPHGVKYLFIRFPLHSHVPGEGGGVASLQVAVDKLHNVELRVGEYSSISAFVITLQVTQVQYRD